MHFRLDHRAHMRFKLAQQRLRIITRQVAEFKIEHAFMRHDVQRRAAMDHAGVHCRVSHVEATVIRTPVTVPPRHLFQKRHRLGGRLHGIDAIGRIGRVRSQSAHGAAVTLLALVCNHRPHFRRLADNARQRLDARLHHVGQQIAHAEAADFLVIGKRQVHRRLQATPDEFRHYCQRASDETFHVGSAAAVEPTVALSQHKWIGGPVLPVHRHHIGMPGQYDARDAARPQRRKQIGLAFIVVEGQPDVRIERPQQLAHVINQFEVGVPADRRKGNQLADQVQRLRSGCDMRLHQKNPLLKIQHRQAALHCQRNARRSTVD